MHGKCNLWFHPSRWQFVLVHLSPSIIRLAFACTISSYPIYIAWMRVYTIQNNFSFSYSKSFFNSNKRAFNSFSAALALSARSCSSTSHEIMIVPCLACSALHLCSRTWIFSSCSYPASSNVYIMKMVWTSLALSFGFLWHL